MTNPALSAQHDETQVVRLTLAPVSGHGATAFCAVRINDDTARVYFNQSAQIDAFAATAQHGDPNTGVQRVVQTRGNSGLFVDVDVTPQANQINLRYDAGQIDIALGTPTPDYLAGHDCLLSTLNQALSTPVDAADPADNPTAFPRYIQEWLAHHAQLQGVTAALFLNRLGPERGGRNFANKLRKNRDALMARHGCASVRFHVYIKDGKAALKASPER